MSFSEYTGSKTKVSHCFTRILRNAQENFPKIQSPPGGSVGALLKSFSNGVNRVQSERLNKSGSSSPQSPTVCKFGFQKLRLGLDKKRSVNNQHAELLDNQEVEDQDSGDDDEIDTTQHYESAPLTSASLIGSSKQQDSGSKTNLARNSWQF